MDRDMSLDRTNYGPDYDKRLCPDDCYGDLRESCGGCDYYDEDGRPIEWGNA